MLNRSMGTTPSSNLILCLYSITANTPASELQTISTEYIPFTDYGEGTHYSLIDNNAACAC